MYGVKIPLPSRGKYGKAFVNVRRPKLADIMAYFQSDNSSVHAKNMFIQSVCDTDLSKYPTGDREHVFANLRSLINSATITGTLPCSACGEMVVYMLDITKCNVSQLPDDFEKDYLLPFPSMGTEKKINLLTVERESMVEDYLRFYDYADVPLMHSDLGENLPEFARYACMLGDTETVSQIDDNITFLRECDWSEFEVVMMYDVAFECGPDIVSDCKCDSCGKLYRARIKTDTSFFGLSLEGLINRHRFLAKASNIGFQDFLAYTMPLLETVTTGEVARVRDLNQKIKAARSKR